MWHVVLAVGDSVPVRQSTPDIMLQGRGLGCSSGKVDALCLFNLDGLFWPVCCEWLEEICYGVDVC
jgi:hypothetical protein